MKLIIDLCAILALFSTFSYASLIVAPTAPVTKGSSLDAKKTETKARVQSVTTVGFTALKRALDTSSALIWHNPLGITPQQAFDALGADAGPARRLGASAGALLNAAKPGTWSDPATCPVTINTDHTVTVKCP